MVGAGANLGQARSCATAASLARSACALLGRLHGRVAMLQGRGPHRLAAPSPPPGRLMLGVYGGSVGPLETVWRLHWDGCAHAGTGSAWPPRTREKGGPIRRAAESNHRTFEAVRQVQVESKFGVRIHLGTSHSVILGAWPPLRKCARIRRCLVMVADDVRWAYGGPAPFQVHCLAS